MTLLLCLSCKPTERSTASTSTSTTDTSLTQQDIRKGSEDVSVAASGKVESNTQKNESEETKKTNFSAPDSTGKQHVTSIEETKKNTNTNTQTKSEWEEKLNAKIDFLIEKNLSLEQQINENNTTETVYKTGLTFWQNLQVWAGRILFAVLLLFGIYRVIKWYLKKQIPTI